MPTVSQYLPFGTGGVAGSPNTLSYASYAALTTLRGNGFLAGIAKSEQINTVLRQVSVGIAGLTKFAVDHGAVDALDDGSVANFKAAIKSALDALYIQDLSGLVPLTSFTGGNQNLASNGYQKLPGGLILQFGSVGFGDVAIGTPGNTGTVTFTAAGGIAFPTACLHVFPSIYVAAGAINNLQVSITDQTTTKFDYQIQEWSAASNPGTLHYLAIGK